MPVRLLLPILCAGIVAGLLMATIQHLRITPLILEAERYEVATDHHLVLASPSSGTEASRHEEQSWAPEDGASRAIYTTLASAVAGAGFALLLAGIALLLRRPVTLRNGALWGLCGFLAVNLAPSAGLPPELPGMAAGDLLYRQIWWVGTVAATAVALAQLSVRGSAWMKVAALLLVALPHVVGAPHLPDAVSAVPAHLAAEFAASTLAAAAIFWVFLGVLVGFVMQRLGNASLMTSELRQGELS